jgi:D-glycero-D-manno-heptose 1,7-bisphosphate phosphatase
MAKHPAIFLDRDGTIIEDNGHINILSNIEFYTYTFKALQNLQEHFLLFIITNQSGISKGLISEDEVKKVNSHIVGALKTRGITIFDVFYCPHKSEENCECKKPKPYFIHHAAGLYNIDLTKSYMVGDHPSDIQCGINAGVTPIYLLSGHGRKHRNELNADSKICKDLSEASKYILSTYKSNNIINV